MLVGRGVRHSQLVDNFLRPLDPLQQRGRQPQWENNSRHLRLREIGSSHRFPSHPLPSPIIPLPSAVVNDSAVTAGHVRARSPIRTAARKSVVGSPKPKIKSPPVQNKSPPVQVKSPPISKMDRIQSPPPNSSMEMLKAVTATYADQMQSAGSKIASDHAPHKAEVTSPPKRPARPLVLDSRYFPIR
jgi:hypothetical protein